LFPHKPRVQIKSLIIPSLIVLLSLSVVAGVVSVEVVGEAHSLNPMVAEGYVDLKVLAGDIAEFEGVLVTTNGTVRYYGSIYMFEDFWLEAENYEGHIMVVTRFAGLLVPPENASIEVTGTIEYSKLEGGFYYLNASSWRALSAVTDEPPTPTPTPTQTPAPSLSPEVTPLPTPSSPSDQSSESEVEPSASPSETPSEALVSSLMESYGELAIILLAVIVFMGAVFLFMRTKKR
jgi:hypothetical protein